MFRLSWLQKRGPTRETLRRDQTRRRRWPGFGLLVCLAFLQSGCQSGPSCGGCSGLFSPCGFFSRVSNRVMTRSTRNADCCGPTIGSGVPIEYGTSSSAVVTPAIPSYPSGTVPSTASPPPTDSPEILDPLPKGKIGGPPPNGGASNSSNSSSRTSYQTRRPVPGLGIARYRNESVARTMASTPEPTSRSAQAASNEVAPEASGSDLQDPLDHLPPLDLPGEVTRSSASPTPASTPPAAPVAEAKLRNPSQNKPGASRESSTTTSVAAAATPAAEPSNLANIGPGLTRFVAVDLKLAGGGAPSAAGLQWLVEKGYRTLLDLREPSEVPSTFIAEVTNKGLRYVALPMSLTSIDRDHVDRFHFEIAAGEARPLFFFDSNGNRAGVLWYIRRIVVDRVDPQIAHREAEELGLVDKTAWLAATEYVARFASPRAGTSTSEARSGSVASPGPASGVNPGQTAPESVPGSTAAAQPTSSQFEPKSASVPTGPEPVTFTPPSFSLAMSSNPAPEPSQSSSSSDPASASDPLAWRPFAAMVVTGLSLPLAYWSRSIVPTILSKTRASLPGPAPRPKSLPAASDD